MLKSIIPKLPMRDKTTTMNFYLSLGFQVLGSNGYDEYLMVHMDNLEIHFFLHKNLEPKMNYGQVYIRADEIEQLYKSMQHRQIPIHPAGELSAKPWGQKEFSILDPDNNLLTFGQAW